MLAVIKSHAEFMRALIAGDANVNRRNVNGETALSLAGDKETASV